MITIKEFIEDTLYPSIDNIHPTNSNNIKKFIEALLNGNALSKRIIANIAIDIKSANITAESYTYIFNEIDFTDTNVFKSPNLIFENITKSNVFLNRFLSTYSSLTYPYANTYVRVISLNTYLNHFYLPSAHGMKFSYNYNYKNWKKIELNTDKLIPFEQLEIDLKNPDGTINRIMNQGGKPLAWILPVEDFEEVRTFSIDNNLNFAEEIAKKIAIKMNNTNNEDSFLLYFLYNPELPVRQFQPATFHANFKLSDSYGFIAFGRHDGFGRSAGSLNAHKDCPERIHLSYPITIHPINGYTIGEIKENVYLDDDILLDLTIERFKNL